VLVTVLTFGGEPLRNSVPDLVYAPLPLLLWATVRFGPGGLSLSLLTVSLLSIWNAMHGRGPFTTASMPANVFSLQLLLCVIGAPLMLLATVMVERKSIENSLRHSESSLSNRLGLEQSISELSRRLANSSVEQLDSEIERGLQHTLETTGAAKICWYVNRQGSPELVRLYSVKTSEARPSPARIEVGQIPYTAKRLVRGEVVVLRNLEDIPQAEVADRDFFREISLKCLLLIPSFSSTTVKGFLGIAFSTPRDWLDDFVNQFTVLANLIATTLERQEAERAKLESEQRFQTLFQEAFIGIVMEDLDGHLLFANRTFCSLLGYSEAELRDMTCAQFSDPKDTKIDWAQFEQLRSGSIKEYQLEKRFMRKDGSKMWGHIAVSLLKNQTGTSPLVIAMVQDITHRKMVEQGLRQKEQEMQQLAGHLIMAREEERQSISRELHDDVGQRVSLVAVGLSRLKEELPAKMTKEHSQIADLLNEAEEISTEVHELSHQLHSSALQHLGLRAALQGFCRKAERQYNVAIALEADDVPDMPSDAALCLFRVAQEALHNAATHSKAPNVVIRLLKDGQVIRLEVHDQGIGFDPAGSTHGIGLITMRERLRMLGGELLVKSAQGEGTEVTATLRLAA